MPRVVFRDLYTDKPGGMLARVPSFTAGMGIPYDKRGWTYLHLDESLEMLMVRLLKSLNCLMLPYLETAGTWLLSVSRARMLIRTVCAASRAYKRLRADGDCDGEVTPLQRYDKSRIQSSSVREMVNLMREKGFLSAAHRDAKRLSNVLGQTTCELANENLQNSILDIDKHGRKSAELHSSAMSPDIFGPLTDSDVEIYLNKKRPRGEWTTRLVIKTAGDSMAAQKKKETAGTVSRRRDPKVALSDVRHLRNRLMTTLTLAEHKAIELGDIKGAEHARERWSVLHSARHILSPFADAHRTSSGGVRHANKSQMLSALNLKFLTNADNMPYSTVRPSAAERQSVSSYFDYTIPRYKAVMIDVMNLIWTKGMDGRRGNTLFAVTKLKMKEVLRPWFSGIRAKDLQQVHLHVDDPEIVIKQKRGEQMRRDMARDMDNTATVMGEEKLSQMRFQLPVSASWESFLSSRISRDAICSLHLFCGAVAGLELAEEYSRDVKVYLHGGCYCLPASVIGAKATDLVPELSVLDETCDNPRSGEVLLKRRNENTESQMTHRAPVPVDEDQNQSVTLLRSESAGDCAEEEIVGENPVLRVQKDMALLFSKRSGLVIADVTITHGEAETRFVAAFKNHVLPVVAQVERFTDGPALCESAYVIISKDTDVTVILTLADCMRGMNVLHVLSESVIYIDALSRSLSAHGMSTIMLAMVYVLAGCDFSAGTHGVTHVHYMRSCVRQIKYMRCSNDDAGSDSLHALTLLAYLDKHWFKDLTDSETRENLRKELMEVRCDDGD